MLRTTATAVLSCLVVCLASALAACAPGAAALPDGVEVTLVQLRSDVADRQAQVRVRNDTDETLRVGELTVADPRFDGAAARVLDRESTVVPGGVVDIRIQLPPMRCPAPEDASSVLTVRVGEEPGTLVAVPIAEGLPFLAALHARECVAAALAAAAEVSFAGFTPSAAGEPAQLAVRVAPTGAGVKGELTAIFATNLLYFGGGPDPAVSYPLDVEITGAPQDETVLDIPIRPSRCDSHAVQEDKRGTVFTVAIVLDGDEGQIQLAAPDTMRADILTWVSEWCAASR